MFLQLIDKPSHMARSDNQNIKDNLAFRDIQHWAHHEPK